MVDGASNITGSSMGFAGQQGCKAVEQVADSIWKEACRTPDIAKLVAVIAPQLAEVFPLAQVVVRRIHASESYLETAAMSVTGERCGVLPGRSEYSPEDMERLRVWCYDGEVIRWRRDALAEPWDFLAPAGTAADVLFVPLRSQGEPLGVLLLIARPGQTFEVRSANQAQALIEPFSVALGNDARMRELAATRAAAEADKQSLLTKLGRKELGDVVVGAETGLHAVMERVDLVVRSSVPVLLLGETGTGKELIARVIHHRSARAGGPFLRVNCGAIPMELVDSQLFGHERGAFTGATDTRQGWFERADGGTLLLDEIGELPLAAQVRLLRILQDGWLERVGGSQPIKVDVRIVAATHRDLSAMVSQGTFREDLWYRVAVFPIYLPPLRERIADIPALARHFAERAAAKFILPLSLPTPDDLQLLCNYPWPGNIRELGAVIDRAAILGNGRRLEVGTALGVSSASRPVPTASQPLPPPAPTRNAFLSLDGAMKKHIEAALAIAKGRIEGPRGAAALLKINPHTLRARMRKLHIEWARFREPDRPFSDSI